MSANRITSLLKTRSGAMMIDLGIYAFTGDQKVRRRNFTGDHEIRRTSFSRISYSPGLLFKSSGEAFWSPILLLNSTPQYQVVFHALDLVFERAQEASARRAVNYLVVARQREADRVDELQPAVGAHRLHMNRADAQYRHLRRVENGREGFDAKAAEIADGEGRAGQAIG